MMNDQPTRETDFDINDALEAIKNDDLDAMSTITHKWDKAYDKSHQQRKRYLIEQIQYDSHFRSHEKIELIQDVPRFVQSIFDKPPKFSSNIIFSDSGNEWMLKKFLEQREQASMHLAI